MPFEKIRSLFTNDIPRPVMAFLKQVGLGINTYGLVGDGDRILIGVSGGADSLALALALALRQRFVPIEYQIEGLLIDFREYPHSADGIRSIEAYFLALGIPLSIHTADIFPPSFQGRFNCYNCGRNRRRIFFDFVRDWPGTPKIALGHHMDDIVETTLINVATRGSFSTMVPDQPFFGGKVHIVRPMALVKKESITNIVASLALPTSEIACPLKTRNIRTEFKPVVAALESIHPGARESIMRSLSNVNREYLPPQGR